MQFVNNLKEKIGLRVTWHCEGVKVGMGPELHASRAWQTVETRAVTVHWLAPKPLLSLATLFLAEGVKVGMGPELHASRAWQTVETRAVTVHWLAPKPLLSLATLFLASLSASLSLTNLAASLSNLSCFPHPHQPLFCLPHRLPLCYPWNTKEHGPRITQAGYCKRQRPGQLQYADLPHSLLFLYASAIASLTALLQPSASTHVLLCRQLHGALTLQGGALETACSGIGAIPA